MDKLFVVYTMKGCPHCIEFKSMLTNEGITFYERDIDEFEEEYDVFVKIVENDYVPAVLVLEGNMDKPIPYMYAPERDYNQLTEAIEILKKHLKD